MRADRLTRGAGVPRILERTLPAHLGPDAALEADEGGAGAWAPYAAYLAGARINANVRQVFPRGFDPAAMAAAASEEDTV
jgi:alkylated DNA repair protein alkB family protein 1